MLKSEAASAAKERTTCPNTCTLISLAENGWDFVRHVVKSYLRPLGQIL